MAISTLWFFLIALIFVSSFFSMAETAYMSINRYRLRHMARHQHPAAKRVALLLERPDRLLGVILLGDTFANILASSLATIIAVHYLGDIGVIIATALLTFIVFIIGQLTPKTFAALHSTPIALQTSFLLWLLLKILSPLVWIANGLSNGLLYILGIRTQHKHLEQFTTDELRTVVTEASRHIPRSHQTMLIQLLDLEKTRVEDIMVPRNDIVGIDLEKPWSDIVDQLTTSQHTRIPIYHEHIDNIQGMLHLRDALNLLAQENLNKKTLDEIIEGPYFIPQGTPLTTQLIQFCQQKNRAGFVVNEYGDIQGLVTLEDILEEIVGEFTTDTTAATHKDILQQPDGNYLIDAGISLRTLNRALSLNFPLDGPKTLNGLILEYLETIPPANICLRLFHYPIEILQIKDNMVKTVRLFLK